MSMSSFADIDNSLAKSQLDIGESSNLAQIAQTYDYSFHDQKYNDYVCILSVLAQAAIDSAKRQFDVDISAEIKRIKKDMNVKKHKYPKFWLAIKKGFSRNNINYHLRCPMNKLYDIDIPKYHSPDTTIPTSRFFIRHELDMGRKRCKKIEELISRYSLRLFSSLLERDEVYLLLRSDFGDLVQSIREIGISSKYVGLMSWLLARAFTMTTDVTRNHQLNTYLHKNKSLLLKVLYEVNSTALLSCFTKTE